jgi:hypothetical protein
MIENNGLIPNHQFGFRHSTIEEIQQNVRRINETLENMQYCSAAFLYISQAFDKVWHTGLLCKLRRSLPLNYFLILKPCLHSRHQGWYWEKRTPPPHPVHINNMQLPQEDVKYLGLHLDRRLTWHKQIFAKTETTRNHPRQNVLVIRTKVKTSHI